jgi:hypothetical protein
MRLETWMVHRASAGQLADITDDHAGDALLSIFAQVPDVTVRPVGCTEVDDGVMSYSISVRLPTGRELLVDVEDI